MGIFSRLSTPAPCLTLDCTSCANQSFAEPVRMTFVVDKHVRVIPMGKVTEVVVDDDLRSPYQTQMSPEEVCEKINEARGINLD